MNVRLKSKEKPSRSSWCMDTGSASVLAEPGLRSAIPSCVKAVARCVGDAVNQCQTQRGHIAHTQAHGGERLERSRNIVGSHIRTGGKRPAYQDQTGHKGGHFAVRPYPVSLGLRPVEDRHPAIRLSTRAGARSWQSIASRPAIRGYASQVEASAKVCQRTTTQAHQNENGYPATGQLQRRLSPHGTSEGQKSRINRLIVPPGDKNGCFWAFYCPATGHLFKEAICTGFLSVLSRLVLVGRKGWLTRAPPSGVLINKAVLLYPTYTESRPEIDRFSPRGQRK